MLNSEENIIIGVVYIPCESSIYTNRDAYDIINNERIEHFHDRKNIIIGGDMNSRTGTLKDFIPMTINEQQNDETLDFYINSTEEFF